jgi:hypothetical protein
MKRFQKSLVYPFFIFSSLALLWAFSVSAADSEVPNANQIQITQVTATGSGCPQGTMSVALSPDARSFTVLFDQFQAESGGAKAVRDQKTCEINVVIDVPSGWAFTVLDADYRGFADLSAGGFGSHLVSYEFLQALPGRRVGWYRNQQLGRGVGRGRQFVAHTLYGPYSDNYIAKSRLPIDANTPWKSCDDLETLRITTSLSAWVNNQKLSSALMTLDSIDGKVEQRFGLGWKRCTGKKH